MSPTQYECKECSEQNLEILLALVRFLSTYAKLCPEPRRRIMVPVPV